MRRCGGCEANEREKPNSMRRCGGSGANECEKPTSMRRCAGSGANEREKPNSLRPSPATRSAVLRPTQPAPLRALFLFEQGNMQ
ncbi:hypothetical protein E6C60_3994 [Paenibacillus algicola]|uniref:Uncharacterized protein n=1 Tax=Paenibacillus algicola TaxID=2565926 RepID=A0A4P8XV13_9BACL|nr:hypothetical protein E6C60_3994 [Paenibacillus algicola]